jgi:2-haloacid dehalogenase
MANPSPIYVFDAFGTLFDVHSAARENAAALGDKAAHVSEIWRAKQLEYTWIYARVDRSRGFVMSPFREVTRLSLHYALAVCGIEASLASQLLESYQRLAPFAEVPATLRRLKASGAKLAILSNADTDMLEDLVANASLDGVFDYLISARAAGTFKPSPPVYALATEVYKSEPAAITFISSNRWDIAGAKAFGFETIWVNRSSAPDEYPDLPVDQIISDLSVIAPLPLGRGPG